MQKRELKGQALALVLIVVVLAIIVVIAVSSRVASDIRQQGLERSSARAESLADSAVEKLTQILQNDPTLIDTISTEGSITYPISSDSTDPSSLDLCSASSTDLSTVCAIDSTAEATVFNKIIKFKVLNSESIESHLTTSGVSAPNVTGTDATLTLSAFGNSELNLPESALYVRAFKNSGSEVRLVGECVWKLSGNSVSTVQCMPSGTGISAQQVASCPETAKYGSLCMQFVPSASEAVSFYRVKALLKPQTGTPNATSIELSLLGSESNNFDLPVAQMAFIRAGVYTGNQDNNQSVFQEANRLVILRPAVPEAFDYVLYNGSGDPIVKD